PDIGTIEHAPFFTPRMPAALESVPIATYAVPSGPPAIPAERSISKRAVAPAQVIVRSVVKSRVRLPVFGSIRTILTVSIAPRETSATQEPPALATPR